MEDYNKYTITEQRPWGYFTVLEENSSYKVKKLVVNPGQKLSLQFHRHREEHWVIVEGTPTIYCGELCKEFNKGESLFIPKEEIHRIENHTSEKVIVIEVQNGDYLGEDDIVRIKDEYSRN